MSARCRWYALWLFFLGCQASQPFDADKASVVSSAPAAQGFIPLGPSQGVTSEFRPATATQPSTDTSEKQLALAVKCLQEKDDTGACRHLALYVAAQPQQLLVRVHYAELLLRLQRHHEARAELEWCIARAQEKNNPAAPYLIHCHHRLMEIAEAQEDHYSEHLHRGIGLYLLSREGDALPDSGGMVSSQSLLCRAAQELKMAHARRRKEARPCWYLYEVWSSLAQHLLAQRYLQAATVAAPFSYLTTVERRDLLLAGRDRSWDSSLSK